METLFYAQPYNFDAVGFQFQTMKQYEDRQSRCRDSFGQVVEEFELQFIDGEAIDAALFEALSIGQCTIGAFIDLIDKWSDGDKLAVIIAVGECGYSFDIAKDDPSDFDVNMYHDQNLKELAEQFVDEGLFGDIPERLSFYLDYDAIARDLAHDYTETTIAGQQLVYRMA
jgi:hypothetical protein